MDIQCQISDDMARSFFGKVFLNTLIQDSTKSYKQAHEWRVSDVFELYLKKGK